MRKKIRISILAAIVRGEGEEQEKDNVKITGDGVMTLENGRIEIRYDEIMGEDGRAENILSFAVEDKNVITLVRDGAISSVMTFSENVRYGGNYNLGFAEFDFTVATRHVSNTVTFESGGLIFLDYSTEIQGVAVQSAKFRFEISCRRQNLSGKIKNIPKK